MTVYNDLQPTIIQLQKNDMKREKIRRQLVTLVEKWEYLDFIKTSFLTVVDDSSPFTNEEKRMLFNDANKLMKRFYDFDAKLDKKNKISFSQNSLNLQLSDYQSSSIVFVTNGVNSGKIKLSKSNNQTKVIFNFERFLDEVSEEMADASEILSAQTGEQKLTLKDKSSIYKAYKMIDDVTYDEFLLRMINLEHENKLAVSDHICSTIVKNNSKFAFMKNANIEELRQAKLDLVDRIAIINAIFSTNGEPILIVDENIDSDIDKLESLRNSTVFDK